MDGKCVKSSGLTSVFAITEETVARYKPLMASYVRHRFHFDNETINDILQDSFLSAIEAQDNFVAANEASVRSWLLTIAKHKSLDHIRSKSRVPKGVSIDFFEPRVRDLTISNVSHQQIIEKLLAHTPSPEEKACLEYGLIADSYEELAQETGVVLANIKTKIHRGRGRLQRMLGLEDQDFQQNTEAYEFS